MFRFTAVSDADHLLLSPNTVPNPRIFQKSEKNELFETLALHAKKVTLAKSVQISVAAISLLGGGPHHGRVPAGVPGVAAFWIFRNLVVKGICENTVNGAPG